MSKDKRDEVHDISELLKNCPHIIESERDEVLIEAERRDRERKYGHEIYPIGLESEPHPGVDYGKYIDQTFFEGLKRLKRK